MATLALVSSCCRLVNLWNCIWGYVKSRFLVLNLVFSSWYSSLKSEAKPKWDAQRLGPRRQERNLRGVPSNLWRFPLVERRQRESGPSLYCTGHQGPHPASCAIANLKIVLTVPQYRLRWLSLETSYLHHFLMPLLASMYRSSVPLRGMDTHHHARNVSPR